MGITSGQVPGSGVSVPAEVPVSDRGDGASIVYLPRSCGIGVMAKSPRPGFSKTRLCPPLAPEQAAQLSGAFLRDTTEKLEFASLYASIVGYAAYAPRGTENLLLPHLSL
jgi:hypothetical protein